MFLAGLPILNIQYQKENLLLLGLLAQIIFRKWGGSKAVWNFSKKSSNLVAGSFPKYDDDDSEFAYIVYDDATADYELLYIMILNLHIL